MLSNPTIRNRDDPELTVVVGARGDCVHAFERLLTALPADSGMTFLLCGDLDVAGTYRSSELLARCTEMPIVEVEDGVKLCSDTVYLLGPAADVAIDQASRITVSPASGEPLGLDRLFGTLAQRFGSRTVGVLLCADGVDGTQGLRDIKDAGGLTVVQTPSSESSEGIEHVLGEVEVDLVLEIEYMPQALNRFCEHQSYSEGHALLASIVANSDDVIISKTLDGIILSWNDSAERIFGYTAEEAVGQSIELIIPPELHGEEKQILAKLRRGERTDHFETVRVAKDGRRVDISLTVSPIRVNSGRIVGASKVARDITERKRAEAALREADRRKDNYLAMLGHELRNPLAAIQSAGDVILQSGNQDALVQKGAEIIDRQAAHMAKLLDGLLDVSRITRGKLEIEKRQVDLSKVLTDVIAGSAHKPQRKHIKICTDFDDLPVQVIGDATRLTQVFANLVDNALKFTDAGGTIWIATRTCDGQVEVTVRDTGAGFLPDHADDLFDAFKQGPQDFSRSQGGLGLGLALARGLVELHDGTIEAQSDGIDCGAEFKVTLPQALGNATPTPAMLLHGDEALQLLLIEDNKDLAQMLRQRLEMQGHAVAWVCTGEEGIAWALEHKPDVLICDLGLPGKATGFDVAQTLRASEEAKGIGLVALSGYGRAEDKAKGVEAGFDVYVTKPVHFDTLLEVLAGFVDRER